MTMRVTRASDGGAQASDIAAASPPMSKVQRCCESLLDIVMSPLWSVVVSIVVVLAMMLVRPCPAAPEAAGRDDPRGCRYAACAAVGDEPVELGLRVLAQHEALRDQAVDRAHGLRVVRVEARIALGNRWARVAVRRAVRGGFREGDHLTRALASVVRLCSGRARPTGLGGEGNRDVGQPHARDVVAVAVGLRYV